MRPEKAISRMKIVIDIEDYDREWIANGYHIPDEINGKIAGWQR